MNISERIEELEYTLRLVNRGHDSPRVSYDAIPSYLKTGAAGLRREGFVYPADLLLWASREFRNSRAQAAGIITGALEYMRQQKA